MTYGLWSELLWFMLHSMAALAVLIGVVAALTLARPDPASVAIKASATALALAVPMLAAFVMARVWSRRPWVGAGRFVWVSGLLVLSAAAVWVYALPTGPGLCAGCNSWEKLWRTFFTVRGGSGLMNGDGLLVGCWVPLATLGYSAGAALGLRG